MLILRDFRFFVFLFILLFFQPNTTFAVNWLMLQGVEPAGVKHRLFLFIQPSFTKDLSREIKIGPNKGKRVVLTTIPPWFEDDSKFHMRRARLGVRGNFTGILKNKFSEKLNYFLLVEFAPNLLTYDFLGKRERIAAPDHFSLTANHIKGAKLRFGLFKTPGLEEIYQGIVAQDYIEFTDFAAREVLERFATGNTRATPSGGTNGDTGIPVNKSQGFNGARDWGVQVFESFKQKDWDYSYAIMLGRGAGIHETSRAQDLLEQYYYLSAEKILAGGKGPWQHGVKYYGWLQNGERIFSSDPKKKAYDRRRYGVGIRAQGALFWMQARQRVDIALSFADGMIFVAPAGGVKGGNLMFAAEKGNKSRAISIDYGYFLSKHWEIMTRWDRHELLYQSDDVIWTQGDARTINTMTYGIQYLYTKKLKLAFNYIVKRITAPNETHPVVEDVVSSIGNRYSVQLTWIY